MHSNAASLRVLTLPAGATSGSRIVLNGITGEIQIFDASNNLVIQIDGDDGFQAFDALGPLVIQVDDTGLKAYDTSGHLLAQLNAAGLFIYDTSGGTRLAIGATGAASGISGFTLWSGAANESDPGVINLTDIGNQNQLLFTPGERGNQGALEIMLQAAPESNSKGPLVQVIGQTLQAANRRAWVDLTGAGSPTGKEPYVAAYDIRHALPNNKSFEPLYTQQYPKGLISFDNGVGNVTLSTTAGTYTDVINSTNAYATLRQGERLKVTYFCDSGGNLLISGSGFATTDTWRARLAVSIEGAAYSVISGSDAYMNRAQVAQSMRYLIPDRHWIYTVPAGVTYVYFLVQASKTSGAGTVTSVLEGRQNIVVEHIGGL